MRCLIFRLKLISAFIYIFCGTTYCCQFIYFFFGIKLSGYMSVFGILVFDLSPLRITLMIHFIFDSDLRYILYYVRKFRFCLTEWNLNLKFKMNRLLAVCWLCSVFHFHVAHFVHSWCRAVMPAYTGRSIWQFGMEFSFGLNDIFMLRTIQMCRIQNISRQKTKRKWWFRSLSIFFIEDTICVRVWLLGRNAIRSNKFIANNWWPMLMIL